MIHYNFSFLIEKGFLKLVKFITQSYLFIAFEYSFLFWSRFSVFLKKPQQLVFQMAVVLYLRLTGQYFFL